MPHIRIRKICFLAIVLFLSVQLQAASTVTFGVNKPQGWNSLGWKDNLRTGVNGRDVTIVQDDISFILNIVSTADNFGCTQLSGMGDLIPATTGNIWEDTDGSLILRLRVEDPLSKLKSLSLDTVRMGGFTVKTDVLRLTDHLNNTTTVTGGQAEIGKLDSRLLGPIALPDLASIEDWSLELKPLSGGTAGKNSGLTYIAFDYTTKDGAYVDIPEPSQAALLAGLIPRNRRRLTRRPPERATCPQ